MTKSAPLALILASLVYLALRGGILFTSFDAAALEAYELHPMGNLAKELIEGGGFPLINYCDSHSGGQLVTGFAAVPFYLLLGHTYLALKMVPLLFGLLVLAVLYYFLRENFSSRAAGFFAFLFALPPTTLAKHSLLAMGNHFEILLFISLLLFCYYRFHSRGFRRRWLAWSGFIAGAALFHNFASALATGLLILVHIGVRGFRNSWKDFLFAFPFFLIGVAPLLFINLGTGGAVGGFLESKFNPDAPSFLVKFFGRMVSFFGEHVPGAGCFESFAILPGRAAEYAWLACFLGAFLLFAPCFLKGLSILARRLAGKPPPAEPWSTTAEPGASGKPAPPQDAAKLYSPFQSLKVLPFGLYLPLLAFAYAAGDFRLGGYPSPHEVGGYRYLLTHFTFATVLIALAAARLSLSRRSRALRAAGFFMAGLGLFAGLFNLGALEIDSSEPRFLGRYYEGYYYPQFSRGVFSDRYRADPALVEAAVRDFRPVFKCRVYAGLGFLRGLYEIRPDYRKPAERTSEEEFRLENLDLPELLRGLPQRYRADAARGIGTYLRDVLKMRRPLKDSGVVEEMLERLKSNPCPEIPHLLEGLMLEHDYLLAMRSPAFLKLNLRLIAAFPPECGPMLWRGQGMLCGRLLLRGIPTEVAEIRRLAAGIPDPQRPEFFQGLGWGSAEGGDTPALPASFEEVVPEAMRAGACRGFGAALRHFHGADRCREALEALRDAIPGRYLPEIEKGMQ